MEKFLTCEDVAERYSVKIVTVWEWVRTKKLPAIKLAGKLYRIRAEDLAAFEDRYKTTKKEEFKGMSNKCANCAEKEKRGCTMLTKLHLREQGYSNEEIIDLLTKCINYNSQALAEIAKLLVRCYGSLENLTNYASLKQEQCEYAYDTEAFITSLDTNLTYQNRQLLKIAQILRPTGALRLEKSARERMKEEKQ